MALNGILMTLTVDSLKTPSRVLNLYKTKNTLDDSQFVLVSPTVRFYIELLNWPQH